MSCNTRAHSPRAAALGHRRTSPQAGSHAVSPRSSTCSARRRPPGSAFDTYPAQPARIRSRASPWPTPGFDSFENRLLEPKATHVAALTAQVRATVRGELSRNDWHLTAIGSVLCSLAPERFQRSRPAGFMADAGLRWCGATPLSTEWRSECQRLRRNHYMPRNFFISAKPSLSAPDDTASKKIDPGPSNLASSRCCSHPRGNYRSDDEDNGLAAALGARFSCRRGSMTGQERVHQAAGPLARGSRPHERLRQATWRMQSEPRRASLTVGRTVKHPAYRATTACYRLNIARVCLSPGGGYPCRCDLTSPPHWR